MESKSKWLTVSQAATELGMSTQGCFYHVKRGALKAKKYRGEWRITPEAVEEFKSQRESGAARVFKKKEVAAKQPVAKTPAPDRIAELEREVSRLVSRVEALESAASSDRGHSKWGLLAPLIELLEGGRKD